MIEDKLFKFFLTVKQNGAKWQGGCDTLQMKYSA